MEAFEKLDSSVKKRQAAVFKKETKDTLTSELLKKAPEIIGFITKRRSKLKISVYISVFLLIQIFGVLSVSELIYKSVLTVINFF